jgi:hypothetical protein
MAPFNTQYPASVFASQDPVAIESVGFDFLYREFPVGNPSGNDFPAYSGVDDFLHQAADSLNWAQGVRYDPENDGTPLPRSMGVHEHWNNATEKKYSRNLQTGEGIELCAVELTTGVDEGGLESAPPASFSLWQNFPNPFNPETVIRYQLAAGCRVYLEVYDLLGNRVTTLVDGYQPAGTYSVRLSAVGARLSSGCYYYRLRAGGFTQTRKMAFAK